MYLGDVAPFIPVARRLSAAGHDVAFVAPPGFGPVLRDEPFVHIEYALDCSPAAINADPVHTALMRHPSLNAGRLATYWMDRAFADDPEAARMSLRAAFEGADIVVTHPTFAAAALPVARAVGAAVVVGHLFPMMIPTSQWIPAVQSRSPNLGRLANRAAWGALRGYTAVAIRDRAFNALRRSCGLSPLRGNAGWAWTEADETVILMAAGYFGEGAADWPRHTWGGFSVWDGPPDQTLDDDLDAFLDSGAPPVIVTFGTSAATSAGRSFAEIASDLDAAGLRSVLLVGHESNLDAVHDHPAARTFAPLTQLLPRASVAVVSGALGSLAAALAAGTPVVVHPQLVDQGWHARRVTELGIGLAARKVSEVGTAVARILRDPSFAERATSLAGALAADDGPGEIVAAVDRLLAQRSRPPRGDH